MSEDQEIPDYVIDGLLSKIAESYREKYDAKYKKEQEQERKRVPELIAKEIIDQMRRESDARLDRIESKLDDLSDAMVALARAEEKLMNVERNNQTQYERMNRFSEKLDYLEKKVTDMSNSLNLMSKFFWVTLTAAVGVFVSQLNTIIN